jgi:alkanesulfonate monooxygenase SsuD/methylene tetrahydromethanopterin reductase-like flavin-dependent oxidoreductase (luciferase family)
VNVFAVALQIERKEAGPYSRTVQTALRAFVVHAEDDNAARAQAHAYFKNQYPHWYLGGLTVELVSLYGVSTEGASWAMENPK